ncbi:MAG: hypothetical protein K8S23_04760 [Candidatus Cloacimonetes bacterium]|nr:hypothetical protein [Candidatus Cloacimonadota bacterium]
MGTQQLILIILSVIMLGSMTIVTMNIIKSSSRRTNINCMIGEMQIFSSQVMQYYKTPLRQSGGGLEISTEKDSLIASFIKFDTDNDGDDKAYSTEYGEYQLEVFDGFITIVGIGNEIGNDGINPINITLTVTPANSNPNDIVINN